MAIPYNPSSFNSNKTILQAIEELKKYLQENPCYKIYMYNDDYVVGTYVYDKSGVDDPDSIEAYDVIFFANSYYSKVESVGDSTITVWPAINFTGAEGPQGPAGADGADGADGANGVSITNVAIDGSKHLICTLSDGNTIDAGEIPTIIHYAQVSNSSGTLTDSQYSQLLYRDSIIDYLGTILQKYSEDVNEIIFQCLENDLFDGITKNATCTITKSTKAYTIVEEHLKIADDSINSESATNGQVLTANGSGGASWETVSGGAVEGTAVLSTGETSGKVLTADGGGGASWEPAGGSSLNKYTYTESTLDSTAWGKIRNILLNAVSITNSYIIITATLGGQSTNIVANLMNYSFDGSNYLMINNCMLSGFSNVYYVYMEVSPSNVITCRVADLNLTNTATGTPKNVRITYYNDTQLH